MFKHLIYLNVFILTTISSKNTYTCRDENNKPVDWYAIYKLPRLEDHKNRLVADGVAYAYITSENSNGWKLSDRPITAKKSIPGYTLAPIYKVKTRKQLFYMLYSDQIPDTQDYYRGGGHAKGVVVGGKSEGFWLVHSVPRYPEYALNAKNHTYPGNARVNGQGFLCITLDPENLELAGQGLFYNDLHVYDKEFPERLEKKYQMLARVSEGEHVKSPPWNRTVEIVSTKGTKFLFFAKSEHFGRELYGDWVAPELQEDLVLQTWPNGKSHQPSTCDKLYRVENTKEITVSGISFPTTKDHSKWAASENANNPWVCVGDINKDYSQEKRGGGTVCLKDRKLWKAFQDTVSLKENCT